MASPPGFRRAAAQTLQLVWSYGPLLIGQQSQRFLQLGAKGLDPSGFDQRG